MGVAGIFFFFFFTYFSGEGHALVWGRRGMQSGVVAHRFIPSILTQRNFEEGGGNVPVEPVWIKLAAFKMKISKINSIMSAET